MTNIGFCMECNKETEYTIRKIVSRQMVRGKEYKLNVLAATCNVCGEDMNVPGLMEQNLKHEDEQLRQTHKLITIPEIEKLMSLYNIGKAPLSLALGFGEVTIGRYMDGQVPSQTYSEIMRNALNSYDYMERLLNRNRDKLANTAYQKTKKQIDKYRKLDEISHELRMVVSYIFQKNPEVDAYALHKLLYFIQGIYMAYYDKKLFPEDSIATKKGPVFENLYEFLKDFYYVPVEDPRFCFLEKQYIGIGEGEKEVINLVLQTFGIYSGATLNLIIQKEIPWQNARKESADHEKGNVIPETDLKRYFMWVVRKFNIDSVEHMNHYIRYKMT